jgi:hypothetical protein
VLAGHFMGNNHKKRDNPSFFHFFFGFEALIEYIFWQNVLQKVSQLFCQQSVLRRTNCHSS